MTKTSTECLLGLEAALHELHSYEVPEFLVLPITVLPVAAGSRPYLDWLFAAVGRASG